MTDSLLQACCKPFTLIIMVSSVLLNLPYPAIAIFGLAGNTMHITISIKTR